MTTINRDEWLTALNEAGIQTADDQDALTYREFATLMQIPRTTAESKLRILVDRGKAVKTSKRALNGRGQWVVLTAFRLVRDSP